MAKRTALVKAVNDISEAVPHLIRWPQRKAWMDYDEEADVLYISLKRPQKATDTNTSLLRSTNTAFSPPARSRFPDYLAHSYGII